MTSSIVSSILLFLLLLLMSPHMNEAFGAQIELGKLGECFLSFKYSYKSFNILLCYLGV